MLILELQQYNVSRESRGMRDMERNECLRQTSLERLVLLYKNRKVQIITKRQLPYFWYLPDNSEEANGGALDINMG